MPASAFNGLGGGGLEASKYCALSAYKNQVTRLKESNQVAQSEVPNDRQKKAGWFFWMPILIWSAE
jgi:hypothetical protein